MEKTPKKKSRDSGKTQNFTKSVITMEKKKKPQKMQLKKKE